jgi:hypothetical protein
MKDISRSSLSLSRHIVIGVMLESDSTEKQRHDAWIVKIKEVSRMTAMSTHRS